MIKRKYLSGREEELVGSNRKHISGQWSSCGKGGQLKLMAGTRVKNQEILLRVSQGGNRFSSIETAPLGIMGDSSLFFGPK